MNENKEEYYRKLVLSRKACEKCKDLINPIKIESGSFDSDHLGPWSLWQGNLDADIMVVGQDWGDINYFIKWKGKDQPSGNPTNEHLEELLNHIGIKIEKPGRIQQQKIFLTNFILCLKKGGLQAKVDRQWITNCGMSFFYPLIKIVNPKIVIGLGRNVSEAILKLFNASYPKHGRYNLVTEKMSFKLTDTTTLFPVYHCGAGSTNRNRKMIEQKKDWERILRFVCLT
jgi:uracil-DNA glycosylase family 4